MHAPDCRLFWTALRLIQAPQPRRPQRCSLCYHSIYSCKEQMYGVYVNQACFPALDQALQPDAFLKA
eukprot:733593-Pelagomonas_calceolata.AAC.9